MKRHRTDTRLCILCVGIGAVILAAAIDVAPLGWLCWLAMAPLFHVLQTRSTRIATMTVALFAAVYYGILLRHFAGFGSGLYVAMVLILVAMYSLVGVALSRWIMPVSSRLAPAGAWVLLERFKGYLGLEWGTLGYTQGGNPFAMEAASSIGAIGLSFLICWFNAHVATEWARRVDRQPLGVIYSRAALAGVAVLLFSVSFSAGSRPPQNAGTLSVTVVPGHFASEFRDRSHNQPAIRTQLIDSYLDGSLQADAWDRSAAPRLIVWPETAASLYADRDYWLRQAVTRRSIPPETQILLGAYGYSGDTMNPRNSAYVLDANGAAIARYDKLRLVPIFEYQPFPRIWSLLNPGAKFSGFAPGETAAPIVLDNVVLGIGICYEESFPDGFREQVAQGAEILLTLGSVSLGATDSLSRHMQVFARFRAVENRRWLIRSINGGRSEIVDSHGRVVQALAKPKSLLDDAASTLERIEAEVPRSKVQTPYVRWGHLSIPWLSAIAVLGALLHPTLALFRGRVRQKGGADRDLVWIASKRL